MKTKEIVLIDGSKLREAISEAGHESVTAFYRGLKLIAGAAENHADDYLASSLCRGHIRKETLQRVSAYLRKSPEEFMPSKDYKGAQLRQANGTYYDDYELCVCNDSGGFTLEDSDIDFQLSILIRELIRIKETLQEEE